jgi:carbon-nitrogen hydrolase
VPHHPTASCALLALARPVHFWKPPAQIVAFTRGQQGDALREKSPQSASPNFELPPQLLETKEFTPSRNGVQHPEQHRLPVQAAAYSVDRRSPPAGPPPTLRRTAGKPALDRCRTALQITRIAAGRRIMSRLVRCSLIQASNAAPPDASLEDTRQAIIDKHLGFIRQAAWSGAQIVCLQEIFYGPYFCAEQTTRWYDFAEAIPGGPTIRVTKDAARHYQTALIVPIYECEQAAWGASLERDDRARILRTQCGQDALSGFFVRGSVHRLRCHRGWLQDRHRIAHLSLTRPYERFFLGEPTVVVVWSPPTWQVLYAAHQHEDDENQKHQAQAAAGIVAPPSAVRLGRNRGS